MTTGRAAAFYGAGKPMQIKEYTVGEPDPGGLVVKMTLTNVCGSDLHQWRGEFDVEKFGRPYPQILGHEMTGTIFKLGEGMSRDTAGLPLKEGDRVVWRYFYPCGSCRACLKRVSRACPNARGYLTRSCDEPPHFYGAFGEYYYVRPGAAIFKVPDELVGHPRVCNEGLRMLGRTGRYLEIGNINPGLTYELDPSFLIFGNRSILGMVYYEAEHLQQALELMARTRTKYPWQKVVSHTFPLEHINEAFVEADQGRVTRAAIVP